MRVRLRKAVVFLIVVACLFTAMALLMSKYWSGGSSILLPVLSNSQGRLITEFMDRPLPIPLVICPGARVDMRQMRGQKDEHTHGFIILGLKLRVNAPLQDVLTYYRSVLPRYGRVATKIVDSAVSPPKGRSIVLTCSGNGVHGYVTLSEAGDGTDIVLTSEVPTEARPFYEALEREIKQRDATRVTVIRTVNKLDLPFPLVLYPGAGVQEVEVDSAESEGGKTVFLGIVMAVDGNFDEIVEFYRRQLAAHGDPGYLSDNYKEGTILGLPVRQQGLASRTGRLATCTVVVQSALPAPSREGDPEATTYNVVEVSVSASLPSSPVRDE